MNNESLKTSGRIIHTSIGAIPTQEDNEWKDELLTMLKKVLDNEEVITKDWFDFVESLLLKQKASIKQKMIKKVATYLISDIEGGRLEIIHTNNATVSAILSALNEIDV